jgi:GNAT superfamily N-acetyltransferase
MNAFAEPFAGPCYETAMSSSFTHRLARREDIPALNLLMAAAIRELLREFLSPEAVEASFDVMGLDTQLIDDGTYFVIECGDAIVGCGGWSHRATLFGGDYAEKRDAALLDPRADAARVRAMYTSPRFARRGIGRLVLGLCEQAAAAAGFARVELAATMAGEPLYRACGYQDIERLAADTRIGIRVPLIRMGKRIG